MLVAIHVRLLLALAPLLDAHISRSAMASTYITFACATH
jgi:hypothetical protein